MKSDQTASANGRTPASPDDSGSPLVPEGLQAKCRRQAMAIDTLGEALSTFERGARALKAENSALRAENDRLRRHRRFASRPDGRVDGGEPAEVAIPIGAHAPRRRPERHRAVARRPRRAVRARDGAAARVRTGQQQRPPQRRAGRRRRRACAFTSGATASGWKSRIPAATV